MFNLDKEIENHKSERKYQKFLIITFIILYIISFFI